MILSDEKITHLTHVLLKGLIEKDAIDIIEEEGRVRREMKRSLEAFLKVSEDIDQSVRKKMLSFSRKITEGSPEWEVLYRKYYTEEAAKKGLG